MGVVKIIPTNKIVKKLGIEPNGRVQSFFTETCYKYMNDYVPMRDNVLRQVVDIQSDRITYESVYAGYQYYGQRKDGTHKVKHYTTPGTGKFWDKRMVSADMNQVVKEVQNFINGKG